MNSKSHKDQIFGWLMYDWANSAYILTVVTAILPAYFASVVVPKGGVQALGLTFTPSAIWGYMVSLAALFVLVVAPILGALADGRGLLKRFLMIFCCIGGCAALGLSLTGPGDIVPVILLFSLAQFGFAGGEVFYDAFLPHLAKGTDLVKISGKGYAYGYIGGGLQFLISLLIISFHEPLGLEKDAAARLCMAMAAIWWVGFALITFRKLKEPATHVPGDMKPTTQVLQNVFGQALATTKSLFASRQIGLFLLAFLFYNDGIQTVIAMATIYGQEELKLSLTVLMVTLLVIQVVAYGGALLFSRLAELMTVKGALILSLVVWAGIVLYAYRVASSFEYFVLGVLVGLVLGGSQALSRAMFAAMIPPRQSASYFSYFSIITKISSVGGPFVFAVAVQLTGSARSAILSVLGFFVIGIAILAFVPAHRTSIPDS